MEQFKLTRRSFLAGTGAAVGSFAAGSVIGFQNAAMAAPVPAGSFPFPASLTVADLDLIKEKAFDGYFEGGCCYGAAYGLVEFLKGKYPGGAWDTIPVDMFRFGLGGAFGWGTLCGALNGANFVINAVYNGGTTATKFQTACDNLMSWYQSEAFPLTDATLTAHVKAFGDGVTLHTYSDGSTGLYNFTADAVAIPVTSVCHSPLCHASVSTWCEASGKTVNGSEKKVRCARLTADVAAKTAELIVLGATSYSWQGNAGADAVACIDCHNAGGAGLKRDDEQGKLDCNVCHDDKKGAYTPINKAPACDRT